MQQRAETVTSAGAGAINRFLLESGLLIKYNPAISPDLTLDFDCLAEEVRSEQAVMEKACDGASARQVARKLQHIILWPKSIFHIGNAAFFVVESVETGDCALLTTAAAIPAFDSVRKIGKSIQVIPLLWANLIKLKNAVLEDDPESTIFPRAEGSLRTTSLGVGARFTTLHWPAVAWVMKTLGLPITANQNSIPRELVYDVDAMLESRLAQVPFPFIGSSVPEGHQGQSVQGMSHASTITLLKHGFHHNRIPWGFNADHQPVGGRFDAIEKELVLGSLFASYITYDMSPGLLPGLSASKHLDGGALETAFRNSVEPALFTAVVNRLSVAKRGISESEIKKVMTYLMPAMKKVKRRDACYTEIREKTFTTDAGRRFFKELSIDELPQETTPETLSVCLAMAEAMGMHFDFVAPNIGFQKNIPYTDNAALEKKVRALYTAARAFSVSIGFHSGSGKSAENYRTIGRATEGCFEVKTSGRYTYEMGVALSQSKDPCDRRLWADWYDFTKQLAVQGAFSDDVTQKTFARNFITASLNNKGSAGNGVFDSPENLRRTLDTMQPSPDHPFWFEYNFLYVLAGKGSIHRLGDHSAAGYEQRSRFYRISDRARLLFAKRIASYILFIAGATATADSDAVEKAEKKLESFKTYEELVGDICAQSDTTSVDRHKTVSARSGTGLSCTGLNW